MTADLKKLLPRICRPRCCFRFKHRLVVHLCYIDTVRSDWSKNGSLIYRRSDIIMCVGSEVSGEESPDSKMGPDSMDEVKYIYL